MYVGPCGVWTATLRAARGVERVTVHSSPLPGITSSLIPAFRDYPDDLPPVDAAVPPSVASLHGRARALRRRRSPSRRNGCGTHSRARTQRLQRVVDSGGLRAHGPIV